MKFQMMCKMTILALLLLLTGCSKTSEQDAIAEVIPSIEAEQPDGGVDGVTPSPPLSENEEVFTLLPSVVPYPITSTGIATITTNINYFNYFNHMPVVSTRYGIFEFNYDGNYSFINSQTGILEQYHIRDMIPVSNYFSEQSLLEDWYFVGAIQTENYVYVKYDYLGSAKLSFFVRINADGTDSSVCIAVPYLSQENLNSFTAAQNCIYFTFVTWENDTAIVSLILADSNGENGRVIYTFEPDTFISNLYPQDNTLYFLQTKDNETSLIQMDTITLTQTVLLDKCTADFLYVFNDIILLSSDDTSISYYNKTTQRIDTLVITKQSELVFSVPLFAYDTVYVALYSLNNPSPTKLVPIDFVNKKVGEPIVYDNTYYHSLGIVDGILYTEYGNSFKLFDIVHQNEIAYPPIAQ